MSGPAEGGQSGGGGATSPELSRDVDEGGSSFNAGGRRHNLRTLDDVMRDPSATLPDVVVLDSLHDGPDTQEVLDPKEDLWLSTSDGRYSSPIVPLRVGASPYTEMFYVHKDILTKSDYFKRALCGNFQESEAQSIVLPEENPSIFHFLIAYLYEGRYDPIKPVASVLSPEPNKGKGKDVGLATEDSSDSDNMTDSSSDISIASRRQHARRRRREERNREHMRQKHPGLHRPNCTCPTCRGSYGPPCWACSAPRAPPPPPPPPAIVVNHNPYPNPYPPNFPRHRVPGADPRIPPPPHNLAPRNAGYGPGRPRRRYPRGPRRPSPGATATNNNGSAAQEPPDPNGGGRIAGEDLRTWLLAYELNIDVYVLANKFLLDGFKREVARVVVDMLETAGSDAAAPEVLRLCGKLYAGVAEADPLLRMVFARVGFLQPLLWRRNPDDTSAFLIANPEIAAAVLRETVSRREEDPSGRALPSMERADPLAMPPLEIAPPGMPRNGHFGHAWPPPRY